MSIGNLKAWIAVCAPPPAARVEEEAGITWVTMHGSHIPIDSSGTMLGGPYKGQQFKGHGGAIPLHTGGARDSARPVQRAPIVPDPGATGKASPGNPDGLGPKFLKIQQDFEHYAHAHTDALVAQYHAKFGNVLNVDDVRELCPAYAASKESRSHLASVIHETCSWLNKEIYKRALAAPPGPGQENRVLFTAGGGGAGKTSALKNFPAEQKLTDESKLVMDGTLAHPGKAIQRIDEALAAGTSVHITYVYREPVDALRGGVLPRAGKIGRTVAITQLVEAHPGALTAIKHLHDHYAGDARVSFGFIDNSHGYGKAKELDRAGVNALPQAEPGALRKQMYRALQEEYHHGRISDALYHATNH